MGRLLPFLELAAATCIVFFSLWGTLSASLSVTPLLLVLLVALVASVGVWRPGVLLRALSDGWGSDPMRKPSETSASVWQFLEGLAPLSGAVGAGVFAVLALNALNALAANELTQSALARRAAFLSEVSQLTVLTNLPSASDQKRACQTVPPFEVRL